MKNPKQLKNPIFEPVVDSSKSKDQTDIKKPIVVESMKAKEQSYIIDWSYDIKRSKSEITSESVQLFKKIGKNKPKDLDLIKKMINLHNEYRFPLAQLTDTTQQSIDVSYEFLIFLSKTNN